MQDIVKPLQLNSAELAVSRRSRESSLVQSSTQQQPPFFQNLVRRFPLKAYALRLPILAIGVLCYVGSGFIFLTIEPRSIQHLLLPNSYSPIVLMLGLGHFCCFSYLFLNSRRGVIVSLVLTALFFLLLQQVLTQEIAAQVVLAGVAAEGIYLLLYALLQLLRPQLVKLHHRLPKRTVTSHQHAEVSDDELPTELPEQSSQAQRKRGRERKHHFFGK
jgi:hypothetical protein